MSDKEKTEGVWVSKTVSTSYGDVTVSLRLDTAIDPDLMLDRLDKESSDLEKKMDKVLKKLDAFNDKTPQKVVDIVIKELVDIHNQQKHNMSEWRRWFKAWEMNLCGNTAVSDLVESCYVDG